MLRLNNEDDISVVYDEFCARGIIQNPCTSEYVKRLKDFIKQLNIQINGDVLLKVASDGYYHTEVSAIRNVPSEYKCYKIKGHVEEWEAEDFAKTDWIFFRTGAYSELQVGDKIKFKISKSEVKRWNDLGLTRNIYPADLAKEN